ncbi:hypothetical protein PVAP13_1KG341205 [Panicum virgatum]|uniref:Uncharacterized protein n=1 Tax=Panicum virgatum TaxID=38727 RepID=A0A8T0XCF4_PANVG|nr:hypothetical protein PVAP13_1KG341205 [Panicum virgatum]
MTVPATKLTSPFPWKPRDLVVHRNNSLSTDSSTYSPLLMPRLREPTSIPASNMRVGACKLSATAFSAFDAPSTHLVVQVDLSPRRRHAAELGHVAAELERTPRAERESSSSTTPSCTSVQPGCPPQSTLEPCPTAGRIVLPALELLDVAVPSLQRTIRRPRFFSPRTAFGRL